MNPRNQIWPPAFAALVGLAIADLAPAQTAHLVADINLRQDANIDHFVDANGRACFRVSTEGLGDALWSSDGLEAGTRRIDGEVSVLAPLGFSDYSAWEFDGKLYIPTYTQSGLGRFAELDPVTGHARLLPEGQSHFYLTNENIAVVLRRDADHYGLGLVRPGSGFNVVPVQGLPTDMALGEARFADADGQWLFMQAPSPADSQTYHLWKINEDTGESVEITGLPMQLEDLLGIEGSFLGRKSEYVSYPQYYQETFVWVDPSTGNSGQLAVPSTVNFGYEPLREIPCGNRVYFNATMYGQPSAPPRLYWFDTVTHVLGYIETNVRPEVYYFPAVAVIGDDLYYSASTPGVGNELRRYRPGDLAPELIADINPSGDGLQRQRDYYIGPWALPLGHRLVMRANDGTSGIEPWIYDADTGVTRRLLDVMPGLQGSDPAIKGVSGGLLYFTADDGVHGREMWVTDATPEGTHLVRDIQTGTNSSDPGSFVQWGDKLVFAASVIAGQYAAYSVPVGQAPATPVPLPFAGSYNSMSARVGDRTFLLAYDGNARRYSFQVGDDSGWHEVPNGLIPSNPCSEAGLWQYESMTPCPSGGLFVSDGSDLWITDGSVAGTYPLASGVTPCEWITMGDRLFFVGDKADSGKELWVSDGTIAGTHLFAELLPGPESSNPRGLVADGDMLYFEAEDAEDIAQLWALDTRTNILRITPLSIASLGLDDPRPFGFLRGRVLIGESTVFWSSHPVYNWNPATGEVGQAAPLGVQIWSYATGSPPFQRVGDRYVALGESQEFGSEPFSYDPITGETVLLADTFPGPVGGVVDFRAFSRGVAFFSAMEPGLGSTLWRTDGTPQGTIRVSERAPQANVIGYRSKVIGQHLYVNAADAEHGVELWEIDFCGADYNYDAAVTIDDLLGFLKDFELGSSDADIVGAGVAGDVPDGAVTIEDLLYFLVHFEAGC